MIKTIARYKNYLSRTNSYLLVATFGFSLRTYFTDWKIIPAFLFGISFMVLLGYLDCRYGFFKAEQEHTGKQNPYLLDIVDKLDEINNRLKK